MLRRVAVRRLGTWPVVGSGRRRWAVVGRAAHRRGPVRGRRPLLRRCPGHRAVLGRRWCLRTLCRGTGARVLVGRSDRRLLATRTGRRVLAPGTGCWARRGGGVPHDLRPFCIVVSAGAGGARSRCARHDRGLVRVDVVRRAVGGILRLFDVIHLGPPPGMLLG